ncbi:MAG: rRNA maturation RNase YbeY [Pseudolabrys sp.]|nr:rRNA maturation RNase YbeY [Pseudolabrys sp.]
MSAPDVDILVQSPHWREHDGSEAAVRDAIAAAAKLVPGADGEISVLLTDDAAMRALNNTWRNIDQPTNVLSFPAADGASDSPAGQPGHLGDIAVGYETLVRECTAEGKDFLHHLSHMAVHGFLHLIGYDHQTDSEAEDMERLESAILARLNIPDPYAQR